MKILFVSSEVAPFAKTGGLADVGGALPPALAALGHDVRIVMPKHATVADDKYYLVPILGDIHVHLPAGTWTTHVRKTNLPGTRVTTYFIQHSGLFDRDGLYGHGGRDFDDNHLRFAVFCEAVIWLLKGLDWVPDVIHCNDWQTALIPVYLRNQPDMLSQPDLQQTRTLLTIHNLAYQGLLTRTAAESIGIAPDLFHPDAMEFYGKANLLKGGIIFADHLSTVSPRYADEIQTEQYGCGLEGILTARADKLTGILNGADYTQWDPATDKLIPANFTAQDPAPKARCKAALQAELGLNPDTAVPLVAMITRLDPQKGLDLVAQAFDDLLSLGIQFAVLGTGAPEYHALFEKAAKAHPRQVAAQLKFDNALAHRIEAAADIFLMPSLYEPCGLNQLYSMKYGAIPIVRETGGLADSVTDATPAAIKAGRATGFTFREYTPAALTQTLKRALKTHADPAAWKTLMHTAMTRDFSWNTAAKQYEKLYTKMMD